MPGREGCPQSYCVTHSCQLMDGAVFNFRLQWQQKSSVSIRGLSPWAGGSCLSGAHLTLGHLGTTEVDRQISPLSCSSFPGVDQVVFQESLAHSPAAGLLLQGAVRLKHALQVLLSCRQAVPQAGRGAVLAAATMASGQMGMRGLLPDSSSWSFVLKLCFSFCFR